VKSGSTSSTMSAREDGPWRSEECAEVAKNHDEADAKEEEQAHPPATTTRAAASVTRTTGEPASSADEEGLRDDVLALSQRVADCSAASEQDLLSRLHGALVRCNAAANGPNDDDDHNNNSSPAEAWKDQARPTLERCLLAALSAAHQQQPSPWELTPVAPFSNGTMLDVVDELLALDPAIAFVRTQGQQNVLHRVVAAASPSSSPPPSPAGTRKSDLVRHIFASVGGRVATALVESPDPDGMRPIEILAAQILMKEERLTYRERRRRGQSRRSEPTRRGTGTRQYGDEREPGSARLLLLVSDLDDSWECARLIANVHAGGEAGRQSSGGSPAVVHACLAAATSVQRALLESAPRRHPERLRRPDSRGNVPLHYAAAA
jgi:hypothetical protein